VTEFQASYRKGAAFMGSLLMIGFLSATVVWFMNSNAWWLIGASLLLIPIPYTLVFIFPINKRLIATDPQNGSGLELNLLMRWGRLHILRSLSGLASFLIFVFLIAHGLQK